MEVVIDGYIYQFQWQGGISRDFDHLIPTLCELDSDLRITLFLHRDPVKPLPEHKNLAVLNLSKVDRFIRPWRLWHKRYPAIHNHYLKARLGNARGKIWFSTYYSLPPFRWEGYQVVLVYDLIHEMFPHLFPDAEKQIARKKAALQSADAVICISHSTAQDLLRFYTIPAEKVFVAENGFDSSFRIKTPEELGRRIDYPFILFVGRRRYYKGFDTLLNAYSQWERNRAIKLMVVGETWQPEEEAFIRDHHLEGKIELLTGVSDDYLIDLYNQAEAFVYPSLYEGFGIPLLEAMSCGCPIVASKIPSTVEVAKSIPYYFEAGDPDGLLQALEQAVQVKKTKTRTEVGVENARSYTWERMAESVLAVFRQVTQS